MSSVLSASFIPRSQRPKVWGERAAERARAGGAKALEQAEAAIAAAFGPAERHNRLKMEVDRAMARGAWDFDVRDRYMQISLLCPKKIDGAIREIERNYRGEARHQDQLERIFAPHANRAHQRRLAHARLFLRWFRRYGDVDRFPDLVDVLTTSIHWRQQAAE